VATLEYTGTLVITSCWCGIELAIPESLHDEAHRKQKSVYCPLGHTFVYLNTTEKRLREAEDRLERERRRVQATRDLLAHEERSHAATRGHLTRAKRKAHAGVCPVPGCRRHFADLERHMGSKHPGLVLEDAQSRSGTVV